MALQLRNSSDDTLYRNVQYCIDTVDYELRNLSIFAGLSLYTQSVLQSIAQGQFQRQAAELLDRYVGYQSEARRSRRIIMDLKSKLATAESKLGKAEQCLQEARKICRG